MLGRRTVLIGMVAGSLGLAAPAHAQAPTVDRLDTRMVNKVSGPGPLNFMGERWNVWATDLGHMFEHEGRLHMVFGDTFGPAVKNNEPDPDWRSNVMARLKADFDPAVGPLVDTMFEDRPGHAGELLTSKKVEGDEITVIPNYGTSVDGRMILHYMSIRTWQAADPVLNHSGLAYSDDDGHTWTKHPTARWAGNTNFGVVAMTQVGRHTYLFGIPTLRRGGVKLARVDSDRILDIHAYSYWNGRQWTRNPAEVERILRSSDPDRRGADRAGDHGLIVPAPVGELSVQWSSYYGKWLMMYSRMRDRYAAVIRTADCLTGPWSEEAVVVDDSQFPTLYAPFMPPRFNDRREIYFSMSIWGVEVPGFPPVPYNVFWMQTALDGVQRAPTERCVAP